MIRVLLTMELGENGEASTAASDSGVWVEGLPGSGDTPPVCGDGEDVRNGTAQNQEAFHWSFFRNIMNTAELPWGDKLPIVSISTFAKFFFTHYMVH